MKRGRDVLTTTQGKYQSPAKSRKLNQSLPQRNAMAIRAIRKTSEVKYFDTGLGSATVSSTGDIKSASLVLITTGDGDSNRDGRKINVISLFFRGTVFLPSTSDPTKTSDSCRVIIYVDKQPNGATATVANILASTSITSFRNQVNQQRFQFLCDKRIDINLTCGAFDGTNDQFGEHQIQIEVYKKMNLPITYSASAGAITDLSTNNIGMLVISNAGDVQFSGRVRVRFTDN